MCSPSPCSFHVANNGLTGKEKKEDKREMDCRSGVYSEVQRRAHEQTVITKSLSLSLSGFQITRQFSARCSIMLSPSHTCVCVCVYVPLIFVVFPITFLKFNLFQVDDEDLDSTNQNRIHISHIGLMTIFIPPKKTLSPFDDYYSNCILNR